MNRRLDTGLSVFFGFFLLVWVTVCLFQKRSDNGLLENITHGARFKTIVNNTGNERNKTVDAGLQKPSGNWVKGTILGWRFLNKLTNCFFRYRCKTCQRNSIKRNEIRNLDHGGCPWSGLRKTCKRFRKFLERNVRREGQGLRSCPWDGWRQRGAVCW